MRINISSNKPSNGGIRKSLNGRPANSRPNSRVGSVANYDHYDIGSRHRNRLANDHKSLEFFDQQHSCQKGIRVSDKRHQRDYGDITDTHDSRDHNIHLSSLTRKLSVVSSKFLKSTKRIALPFAALSTIFLSTGFERVHAETKKYKTIGQWLWERGNIENNPFSESGTAFNQGLMENFKEAAELWTQIGEIILGILNWFNHLPENIANMSVDLLNWTYKILTGVVLQVPSLLFSGEWFKDNILTFTSASILVFTIYCIINGTKKAVGYKKDTTELKAIIKRYIVTVLGIGFAPWLFKVGFTQLNKLATIITSAGYHEIPVDTISTPSEWTDVLALLGFDGMLIAMLVPLLLQNGRRWADLILLAGLTPFALSARVFNHLKHYYTQWWNGIKEIGMVQIVYAVFIALIGGFMFASRTWTSGFELCIRLLIFSGSLWRMGNPPMFVKRMMDSNNTDIIGMYKNMWNTVTLKNLQSRFSPIKKVKTMAWTSLNSGGMRDASVELGERSARHGDIKSTRKELKKQREAQDRVNRGKRSKK